MHEDSDIKAALAEIESCPPVTFTLDALSAWTLLGNLQLALRHPANVGPTSAIARAAARQIQDAIASASPVLGRLAERGWHSAFDLPAGGKG